jgi:hypothetical protein
MDEEILADAISDYQEGYENGYAEATLDYENEIIELKAKIVELEKYITDHPSL